MKPSIAVLTATLLLSCAAQAPEPSPAPASCDDPLAVDSFADREQVQLQYATNLAIEYRDDAKLITIRKPWRGADFSLRYRLVPCGPVSIANPTEGEVVLPVPARRFVTTSSTQLPHAVSLGLSDRLIGHDRFDYVTAAEIRQRIDQDLMAEVGDGVRLNSEVLLNLQPDLVFVFSIGNPELDILQDLRNARIPFAVDAAWVESTPLARAEWIKFTAVFFNKETKANAVFERIAVRYEELVRLAASVEHRPTVLAGAPFRGTWYVPGGRSFQARFVLDAGGDYLWADDTSSGSVPLDFEAVYGRALYADVWIDPSDWRSLDDGLRVDRRMGDFTAFRQDRVYNNDRRMNDYGGNDYWETGSLRPDLVLADLIKILHPDLLPEHELVFRRRLEASD